MSEKLNLKQKLVAIRKKIGVLQKTEQGNKGAKYVDPAVVLLKIREAMDEHGVLLTIEIIDQKNTQVSAPTSNNPNNVDYLCENTMSYTWHDIDSTDTLSCHWSSVGSHMQDPSMAFGGSLTYSERYFLLKFFQVPTTKDDPEFLKEKSGIVKYLDEKQISQITDMLSALDKTVDDYCEYLNVKSLEDVPKSWFDKCVAELQPMEA